MFTERWWQLAIQSALVHFQRKATYEIMKTASTWNRRKVRERCLSEVRKTGQSALADGSGHLKLSVGEIQRHNTMSK